jgi:uncharacterized protein (TIGR02246 family)
MSVTAIAANNRAFERAVETGDVDAIAALLAPDVMALPPDGPIVRGKDAVRQLWASSITDHGLRSCRISTDELDVVDDLASEVGHATLAMVPASGESQVVTIKFVVVWKRVDGRWLLHRDIWNATI